MQVFLTTTGTQTNTIINDLGKALFVHPKTNIPLIEPLGEFTVKDVSTSTGLIAAITSGFITLTNIDGSNITSLTDITNKENDHGNQTGLLDDDHCFSADTELLTNRGFISYKEIKDEDLALTFNLDTDKLEYQSIEGKYIYSNFKELVSLKNRYGEILVTKKHTIIFKNTTNVKIKNPSRKWFNCTAEEALNKSVLIIPTGGFSDGKVLNLDNRFLELLGIIISEGHFLNPKRHGYGIKIFQNAGEQADYIRQILIDLDIPFNESDRIFNKNKHVIFYIKSNWARENIRVWLDKKNIPEKLMDLRGDQFLWFLSGLILGDGSCRSNAKKGGINKLQCLNLLRNNFDKTIQYSYHSGDRSLIDNLAHLCTLNGLSAYSYYRKGGFKDGRWSLNIKNSTECLFSKGQKNVVEYEGDVWCVSVPNKTLVLRRHGFIFVAGNTQYLNNTRGDLRYPSRTLTSANVYVGNASNVATPVPITGDATLSNTGTLTLSNVGTAGTYKSVTTDTKGRVIAGTSTTTTTLQYFNAAVATTNIATFAVVPGMSLTTTATIATTYLLNAMLNIKSSTNTATVIEVQVFVNGVADPDTLVNYSTNTSASPVFVPINKSYTNSPVGAVYDIRWRRVSGTATPTVTTKSLILQEIL